MKTIILTFSKVSNRGANLQSYALCNYLRNKGFYVEFLNVKSPERKGFRDIVPMINNFLAGIFRKKNGFRYTRKYRSIDELKNDLPKADVYIVGSDQVWNTDITFSTDPRIYFFTFLPESAIKIAYAASFGTDKWNPTVYDDEIIKSLHLFKAISVRESSGVNVCKEKFGIENVPVVLDPTLLMATDTVASLFVKKKHKKQIFCYLLAKDTLITSLVVEIKEKLQLPVFGYGSDNKILNAIQAIYGVSTWLSYIDCSEFIVTNSFHCVVFCILLHKQFIAIPAAAGKSGRITSLLEVLGLEDRFVDSVDILSDAVLFNNIDYEVVYSKLNIARNESEKFLNTVIEQ